ncbi:MAG: sulfatase-like hydrolase/transferase [Phycisphaerales bacterium]|nr:sulfatase-like hydrolase/transferase [Phycisphaerales bacterium]
MSGLSRRQFMQTTTAATLAAMLSPAQSTMGDPNRPLNLLMICVDDLNSWIGCLGGHPQVKTPNLDRLAQRGLLFTNAHCAGPICNPARAALLTGRHPCHHGTSFAGPAVSGYPDAAGGDYSATAPDDARVPLHGGGQSISWEA